MNLELKHYNSFTNDVIIVDGFWGGCKSVVTSLVGSLTGVEKKKVDGIYEYVCITHSVGKISDDAAKTLLKIYADHTQYNNLIGREVNLRWSDDTGLRNNPGSLSYFGRLFHKGGDSVIDVINSQNLALLIASHGLFSVSNLLFEAYGSRMKLIEVVRHPVHLFNNVRGYIANFERAREFTLSFDYKGEKIPWFAAAWADEFVESSIADRALLSISRIQKSVIDLIDSLAKSDKPLLVLAFEQTVTNPTATIDALEKFLDRTSTKRTKRVLKQQSLPRAQISAGKSTSSFSFVSTASSTEEEIYSQIVKSIESLASEKAIKEFRETIKNYNARWVSPLNELESLWSK